MSDLLINYQIDVEELLEDLRYNWSDNSNSKFNPHALSRARKTGENIMFCCPSHAETKPSCGMKLEYPYAWNCFGCGASGNIASLVSLALSLKDELQGEKYILNNYLITSASERKPINLENILDGGSALDRKRSLFEEDVQKFTSKRHTYIYNRGFSETTILKYEVGYDEVNKAVTFPVRTAKGNIRFIKKRFVSRKGFLNESGIDKKDIVYGLYYILQSARLIDEIFLNESETDTMACYESKLPACAILGRILFKDQVKELVKAGIRTINLFFDNDKHGVSCIIKSYQMLSAMTAIRLNVVLYPGGQWGIDGIDEMLYKDANDLLVAKKMGQIQTVPIDEFLSKLTKEALEKLEEMGEKMSLLFI